MLKAFSDHILYATCHNQRLRTAGLTLDVMDVASLGDRAEDWENVLGRLRARTMPPPPLAPRILRWFTDPELGRHFLAAAGASLQFLLVSGSIVMLFGAERLAFRPLQGPVRNSRPFTAEVAATYRDPEAFEHLRGHHLDAIGRCVSPEILDFLGYPRG